FPRARHPPRRFSRSSKSRRPSTSFGTSCIIDPTGCTFQRTVSNACSTPMPDGLPRSLGATVTDRGVHVAVWAPKVKAVAVRIVSDGKSEDQPLSRLESGVHHRL